MSKLFRASLIITVFFGINKAVALVRQYLMAKQFGLSAEIDAFNVSNNVPDLLFSLISGGALALAFIPILTEYLDTKGKKEAWKLFSLVANLVFVSTSVLALAAAVFAKEIIASPFGIAPGFSPEQQALTVKLMQLNLIATLIFSLSGLVMAALQAHKHFLLTAIAPILYNVGQIIGITIITPLFDAGVYGLAYGVILGAFLHLLVQIPGMIYYGFQWAPRFNIRDEDIQKVLRVMGPRILTVLCIQLLFLSRDNLASRLQEGAVSALTYAYYIMQVPETLVGTAIGTALLPTLSQFAAQKDSSALATVINKSMRIMFALTVLITVISTIALQPLVELVFDFDQQGIQLLVWTTHAYMFGLFFQSFLEVTTRTFYAQQDAKTPLVFTFVRMVMYIGLSLAMLKAYGAVGLALADTFSVAAVVCYSVFLLSKQMPAIIAMRGTLIRTSLASIATIGIMYGSIIFSPFPLLVNIVVSAGFSCLLAFGILKSELQMLMKL